jgi:amidophosphoribosyltransferase
MSGIFGAVTKQKDCFEVLLYGTDYHSHLGTEYGGMAILGKEFSRKIHHIGQSQFKSKFYEDYANMPGNKGIGVISADEEQPMYLNSRLGPFAICTNGRIDNIDSLVSGMLKRGISFSEVKEGKVNSTEVIAKLINEGKNITDGIEHVFRKIEGSCSLLLLNKEGVYAARDRYGYSPLIIGEKDDAFAVTSETASFPNTGFKVKKYLLPGELTLINESGLKEKRKGGRINQICTFLWIYTGFPASSYEGINAEIVRERSGRLLARNDNIRADLVSGVPDSGTAHAIGYSMESKIPFRRPLVKYNSGYGRSYTPPAQATRDLVAKMKLIPIRDVIKNNRIVICEDSIVRGTQLKNFTVQKLWENGAKEIHVRPACPPLMFPCRFNISTRSLDELAARRAIKDIEGKPVTNVSEYIDHTSGKYRKMIDWIARDLGVTSLKYQTVDDMVKAIGLPRDKLCLYCWTGKTCLKPGKARGSTKGKSKPKHACVTG